MPRKPKEPVTGYANLQRLSRSVDLQIGALERLQKDDKAGKAAEVDVFSKLHDLCRSAALLQAELRKTGEDAEKAFANLTLERQVQLLLGLVERLPPEYRRAIGLRIDELGDRLL